MRKLLKNHRGVSMVEVLITVAILAIVVAPCLAAFVTAQRGNVLAKETAAQYTEASNLMEELKAAAQDPNGDGLTSLTDYINDISNNNGASIHVKYLVIDEPITKQEPETPEMHEETPQNPTSHIVSQVKKFVKVWICSGVRDDQVPPSDYILSGVITPNIAAESQASALINELAKNAEEKKWAEVVARLVPTEGEGESKGGESTPSINVWYQFVPMEFGAENAQEPNFAHVDVWVYEGSGFIYAENERPTDIEPIMRAVIVPDSGIMEKAKNLMIMLQTSFQTLAEKDNWGTEEVLACLDDLLDGEESVDECYAQCVITEPTAENANKNIKVCIYAGNGDNDLLESEEPPADCILHGVIEFDSLNDSAEDPIESQADTQT